MSSDIKAEINEGIKKAIYAIKIMMNKDSDKCCKKTTMFSFSPKKPPTSGHNDVRYLSCETVSLHMQSIINLTKWQEI